MSKSNLLPRKTNSIRLFVVSNRKYQNRVGIFRELSNINLKTPISVIIQNGDDRGVDAHSREWARRNNVPVILYDRSTPEPNVRDRDIRKFRTFHQITTHKPDLVLAWAGTGDTHDIIKTSMLMGYPTKVISDLIWKREGL